MSQEKEKEALQGSEEEKTALKNEESGADNVPENADLNDSTFDNSRARFINNSTNSVNKPVDGATPAEVYVDVDGKTKLEDDCFVGLTKEELMQYADDPYWKKVRLALLILFWVGWVAMFAAAIIIIVLAPKCPPRPKLDWWQTSAIYQVYPKSFKDSNGDGVGDLNGVHDKLNYLAGSSDSLNVSALYFNPIYPHGGTDGGYDITDFTGISEDFGTMEDFENLRIAMHKKNLKVILDFIPNHSSDKHPWFTKSQNREGKYADYYVWSKGEDSGTLPPNNWQGVFGGAAWTKDTVRGEWYLHQFKKSQPDLNIRNPDVQEELQNVLQFWLDAKVDGFRVDAISHLFECVNMTNDGLVDSSAALSYDNLDHSCSQFQPETYEIVTKWREMLDAHGKKHERTFLMLVETYGTANQTAQFFEYNGKPGAHMPTNMVLTDVKEDCKAQCLYDKISKWQTVAQDLDVWSNWQMGNHDNSRLVSRFSDRRTMINAMNMLLLTLPGTSVTYYGEEIGMHDTNNITAGQDERDKYRSPLQWSNERFAGFTEGNTTWVSIPDDYTHYNIKTQKAHGAAVSNLEVYAKLVAARKEPSFQWGELQMGVTGNVLFYVRKAVGFPGFLVAINFGPEKSTVDFVKNAPEDSLVPDTGKVFVTTENFPNAGSDFDFDTEADLSNLILEPAQGVVFKLSKEDPK